MGQPCPDCIDRFHSPGNLFLEINSALKGVLFSMDPPTDLNSDGVVNFLDLGVLKSLFFAPPGVSGIDNICSP